MKACGRMMRFLEKKFNAALKLVKEKLNKNTNRPMIDEAFMLNHICKSRKRHTTNQGFKTQMMVGKTRSLAKNDIRTINLFSLKRPLSSCRGRGCWAVP